MEVASGPLQLKMRVQWWQHAALIGRDTEWALLAAIVISRLGLCSQILKMDFLRSRTDSNKLGLLAIMRGRGKTTLFWAVMLLAMWLLVESVSLVAYRVIYHSFFSYSKAVRQLIASGSSSAAENTATGPVGLRWEGDYVEVLHPYFGFVADPDQSKSGAVSEFGFYMAGNVNPVVKRSPEKVTVGLFGGSFGAVIYSSLKPILDQRASDAGKELVLINLAAGGYKQPQQLMILNYLLALGAEFDLIINIDGFNEVSLPPFEHIPSKVNPFFPRLWDRRTVNSKSPATIRLIGFAEVARRSKEKSADTFRKRRLYWSPTLFMFWQARDKSLAKTLYERKRKVRDEGARSQAHTYTMRGPAYVYKDDEQLYRDLVDVWKRSSLQMKVLADANGAKYYHFLQPNQYVTGSKPTTEAERRQAVNDVTPYKEAVLKGYPLLQKGGHELKAAGVNFTDLTMVFANNLGVLYMDDCCHTNADGSDIVAKRIDETVYGK